MERRAVRHRSGEAILNKWISVKDRMPTKRGSYLTFCVFQNGQSDIKVKLWTPSMGFTSQQRAVTHWMELPEPPEANE